MIEIIDIFKPICEKGSHANIQVGAQRIKNKTL